MRLLFLKTSLEHRLLWQQRRGVRSLRRITAAQESIETEYPPKSHRDESISPEERWKPIPGGGELKYQYTSFGPPKIRFRPPYLSDQSLENAQINKHIFKMAKKSKDTEVWRTLQEEKKARRQLPVPVSLTGLGFSDSNSVVFWRQKIRSILDRIKNEVEPESDNIVDKMSPVARVAMEHMPEKFCGEMNLLKQSYEDELAKRQDQLKHSTDEKVDVSLSFPYSADKRMREKLMKELELEHSAVEEYSEESRSDVLRLEQEDRLNHYNFLSTAAKGLTDASRRTGDISIQEAQGELDGWRDLAWRRSYGSANPTIAPSKVPCPGCGAFLHCVDAGLPGYLPSEKFVSVTSRNQLKQQLCQRCEFLDEFNVALDISVDTYEYDKIIRKINKSNAAVLLMLDLTDFPCSMWHRLPEVLNENRNLYIVANKVDLLPKDQPEFLDHIKKQLIRGLRERGIESFKYVSLISAKSGFGVEKLITKLAAHLFSDNRESPPSDIFLVGSTNVGKSSLFNLLLQSDLCALRTCDLIQRATTSVWPGTTLHLLKFPIRQFRAYEIERRQSRVRFESQFKLAETSLRNSLYKVTGQYAAPQILDRVHSTFRREVAFTAGSDHPDAPKVLPKPFNDKDPAFAGCNYFWDTPGSLLDTQLLSKLTTEELIKTLPKNIITPRTFSLQPLQSLFIAGLARIDVLSARQVVYLTVFASEKLPIHIVYTKQAQRFYQFYLGTDLLAVPNGDEERLSHWPPLLPNEITVEGKSWTESGADIVLSSAGWVAVTVGREETCVLKAFTPDGKGIYKRDPCFLPFAVNMRGRRIRNTPVFEAKVVTIEDNLSENAKKFFQRMNERSSETFQSYKAFKKRSF